MAFLKVTLLVLAAMLALGMAGPQYDAPVAHSYDTGPGNNNNNNAGSAPSPASYSFSYDSSDAESGNYYGHAEQREGTSSSGEYRVLLPDGRTQIVTYTVDGDGGYVAHVKYEQSQGNSQSQSSGGGYQTPSNEGGYS